MTIIKKQIIHPRILIFIIFISLFFLTGCFGPPSSIKYEQNGRNHLKNNDYSKAIEEFTKAIEKNPNNSFAYNNRGIAYASIEKYELAINDFSKAIELKPELLEPYNNRGFVLELQGKTREAIQDFGQSTRINENNEIAKNNLAEARRKIGDLQQIIDDLSDKIDKTNPILPSTPENEKQILSNLYLERALAKYDLFTEPKGQKPSRICKTSQYCNLVINDLANSIKIDPNNPKSHRILGLTYRALENFDKALLSFDTAVNLDMSSEISLSERGWTYMEMMQPYQALEDIEKSIILNPENNRLYRLRSWVLISLGEWEQANNDIQLLLDSNPQDPQLHYFSGLIKINSGAIEEGIKNISLAQNLLGEINEPSYSLAISQARLKQKDYPKALENINIALQSNDKYTYAYLLKARINMLLQNFDEAKYSYEAALRLSIDPEKSNSNLSPIPDIPNLFKSIGQIGVSATVKKPCPLDSPCLNSLSTFSKTLDNNPNDIPTLMKRAELLVSIGELKNAINDYTKILQLTPSNIEAILLMSSTLKSYLRYESQGTVFTKCKPGWFSQCNQAIKSLDFVINTNPNKAQAYFSRAELNRLVNRPDLAIQDLNKAINLEPYFTEAFIKRGLSYIEIGNIQFAIDDFNQAISLDSNNKEAISNRGIANLLIGNISSSEKDFKESINLGIQNEIISTAKNKLSNFSEIQ
ncbi:MAG: tetratricopeptide repeat protein [SAR202 cluster bacterium]|nr:tetratricopeptide repeat protein [SAR202 cluster bacterium]|tara:strand:+ start:1770 stop:3866 length:2097 start_codon:yes stop_codon:yes gene_type:complete